MSKKKNKKNKKTSEKPIKEYMDVYYMTSEELKIRFLYDNLINSLTKQNSQFDVHLWEEVGVIEVTTSEKSGMDIEYVADEFQDEEDVRFLEENKIKTIYSIKLDKKDISTLLVVFESVLHELGGFLCSDSDDFMPILAGEEAVHG